MYRIDGKVTFVRVKKSGEWPKFLAKAAATRRLVPFALHLATKYNSGTLHDRRRLGVVQALDTIYQIFGRGHMFLERNERDELARLSVAFIGMYRHLSVEARGNEERAWKMTPKFHLMQHILEHQSWINPRMVWTYGDEDLQKIVKEIAVSCHTSTMAHMVLHKWVVGKF